MTFVEQVVGSLMRQSESASVKMLCQDVVSDAAKPFARSVAG